MKESYKAAVCIGRQPKSDVWVFGEQLQLNSEGQIIDVEISSFVWVKDIFDKLEENGNKREKCALPLVNLPLSSLAVGYVVDALFQILHDNAMAGVFTIGIFVIKRRGGYRAYANWKSRTNIRHTSNNTTKSTITLI